MKKEVLKELQAIAKEEFRRLVSERLISGEEAAHSTLGTIFGDGFVTFELYIPAAVPHEAKVIATVTIDVKTRAVSASRQ